MEVVAHIRWNNVSDPSSPPYTAVTFAREATGWPMGAPWIRSYIQQAHGVKWGWKVDGMWTTVQTCWDQAAQVLEAIVCKKKSQKVFSSACRDGNLKNQPNNGPATCTLYVCTLRFRTRRFSVFSPSTKLMASIKLDFPRIKANSLQQEILIKHMHMLCH